jgi:hypothetical protein
VHEAADLGDGLIGLVEHRLEPVPDVDHRRPLAERDVDAGLASAGGESARVVEQHLVTADVDEQRRQPAQIGVERRDERPLRVRAAEIRLRQLRDRLQRDDAMDGGL